ncbi:MAG TPA: GerMN domain-containing protein [Terriglobales bacterium]|nr:GerMN domain-containing protein [Terriglobales bacterium]
MIPRHLLIAVAVMLLAVLVLGFYAGRVRSRVTQFPSAAQDVRPVTPPASGPTERVTLYVAYDDAGVLRAQVANIPLPAARQQRAEEVLRSLLGTYLAKDSPHPIAAGSEVRAVYLVDPGLAVIDLNAAFANGHRSGILEEELTVASLIQTLAANIPGILRVKILVEGRDRETLAGHADLSDFYDASAVSQLAGQLQAGQ